MQVSSEQWSSVRDSLTSPDPTTTNSSLWSRDAVVALIQWVPSLTKTPMPAALRRALEGGDGGGGGGGGAVGRARLRELEPDAELSRLAQWSDLVVFDYLTGNHDRVSYLQDGARRERRPAVLRETVHNLGLSEETGSLWMIDNESAFLDGYSLMYDGGGEADTFRGFHRAMLETMCVFR